MQGVCPPALMLTMELTVFSLFPNDNTCRLHFARTFVPCTDRQLRVFDFQMYIITEWTVNCVMKTMPAMNINQPNCSVCMCFFLLLLRRMSSPTLWCYKACHLYTQIERHRENCLFIPNWNLFEERANARASIMWLIGIQNNVHKHKKKRSMALFPLDRISVSMFESDLVQPMSVNKIQQIFTFGHAKRCHRNQLIKHTFQWGYYYYFLFLIFLCLDRGERD